MRPLLTGETRAEAEALAYRLGRLSPRIEACAVMRHGITPAIQVRDQRSANPLERLGVRPGHWCTLTLAKVAELYFDDSDD